MAVESINGINIEENYKIPNLANLTKVKNSSSTGRKKRGHVANSIEPDKIRVDIDISSNEDDEIEFEPF